MHESESEVAQLVTRVRLLAIPWTAAYQAPLSMEFSRQEYWSGLPLPSPKFPLLQGKRKWQPIPVFLLGKFQGQRSLAGYSPWGHKESDTTERLSTTKIGDNKYFLPYEYQMSALLYF